jgi:3-methyladenine DNA glycosylase/8-oxoguanine DNA glycosylase
MTGTILWALINGIITGGVWVGIVMLRRQQRRSREEVELLEDLRHHLDDQEAVERRLAELEQRLEFTERMLGRDRAPERLPPPTG